MDEMVSRKRSESQNCLPPPYLCFDDDEDDHDDDACGEIAGAGSGRKKKFSYAPSKRKSDCGTAELPRKVDSGRVLRYPGIAR